MQRAQAVVGLALTAILASITGCSASNNEIPESATELSTPPPGFQKHESLPAAPPELEVEGESIDPYLVEWGETIAPEGDGNIDAIPTVDARSKFTMHLHGSAPPSGVEIGIYDAGLDEIDPTSSPDRYIDCTQTNECVHVRDGGRVDISPANMLSTTSDRAVVTLLAEYFAPDGERQPMRRVAWVFEVNPKD